MELNKVFIEDEIYRERLLISVRADQRELASNIRAARAILHIHLTQEGRLCEWLDGGLLYSFRW